MKISSVTTTFVLGCSLVQSVVSQQYWSKGSPSGGNPSPSPGTSAIAAQCPGGLGMQCRECSNDSEPWKTDCNMRVSMKCTFVDEFGDTQSCFPPGNGIGNDTPKPRFFLTEEQCRRPQAFDYVTTIEYEMCNDNNVLFTPRTNPADAHYVRFSHNRNLDSSKEINPGNWFNALQPNTCRKHTETRTINPCSSDARGLSIAMDGNLQQGFPNYCRCFLREWILSDVEEGNTNSTVTPTLNDTLVPTPSPTIDSGDCDFQNVIITELASPEDIFAKYIELLFLDEGCEGQKIDVNLYVGRYIDGSCDADLGNDINLKGVTVGEDGFVTICNHEDAEFFYGRGECSLIGGLQSVASLRGIDAIAVGSNLNQPLDIFGMPCQSCVDTESCITNGRAVRKIDVWTPKPVFRKWNWHIFPGKCVDQEVGPEGMDINEWKDVQGPICRPGPVILITEIVDMDTGRDSNVPRFVELHAPRKRDRGQGFQQDLKLVIFHGASPEPHWDSAIPIDYMPESGFLVVCNKAASVKFGNKCALVRENLGGPADSNGYDNIALVSGDEDGWFLVDIFGVVGEDGYDTDHDFHDSRVIRKLSVSDIKAIWSKEDWTICKGKSKPDPNEWENDECKTGDDDYYNDDYYPTDSPTTEDQGNCQFFFTELADGDDSAYVEIKSTCPGITIQRDLVIRSYKPYGASCDLNLKGFTVPDDGFIIICKNEIQHHAAFGGNPIYIDGKWRDLSVCDFEDSNLLTGHGYNSYVLMNQGGECDKSCEGSNCSVGCTDVYLDIYGYIGTSLEGTQFEYKDCRAVRSTNYGFGVFAFQPKVWEVNCHTYIDDGSDATCDPREWTSSPPELVISELCDPSDNKNKRSIAIYSLNKRNYEIKEDYILMKWVGSSPYPSYTFQPLKGKKIDEAGFLTMCLPVYTWGQDTCDLVTSYSGIVGSMYGTEHYAIAKCRSPSFSCEIVDIYGEPGTAAAKSEQDFTNGRAVRQLFMSRPTDSFKMYEWVIESKITADVCGTDPYYPAAPSPTPPSSNASNASNGKGKGYRNYSPSKGNSRKLRK